MMHPRIQHRRGNRILTHGRFFAFTLSVEKIDAGVVLELDAVPVEQIKDLPELKDGLIRGLSGIQTFAVHAELNHDEFSRLVTSQPPQDNEEWWWVLELSKDGTIGAMVYADSTDSALGPARALLRTLSIDEANLVRKKIRLPEAATPEEIGAALNRERPLDGGTFVAVYNVGQGLASAICDVRTSAPLMYFDFGCGERFNRHTAPAEMKFCFTHSPPIVLSHWHTDHYMAAELLDSRALKQTWIAPEQSPPPAGARFAAQLMIEKRLLIWPRSVTALLTQWGTLVKCTGNTLNTSGLAMVVSLEAASPDMPQAQHVLLPGDAGYCHIPRINGMAFDALVASHHGGYASGVVPRPVHPEAPFVLSYGRGNTHDHPKTTALDKLAAAGWLRDQITPKGNIALGPILSLPRLGCRGDKCDLCIHQL